QLFMWCAVFIIAFKGVDNIDYFDKAINRVMLFFPIVLALYLSYAFSDHYKASDQANSIYYCLLFLPFVLAYKRKYLNVIYIAALFACSSISLKRTAIIGLVLSVFIFYVVELYTKDELKKKFAIIVGSILLIIICVGSYNFLADNFNIDIISRFDSISSDEGSGRKYIWEEVWNQQKNAPIKHWILGEGSNGVYYKANIFLLRDYVSAHDDFLEVLYDYGIFGFIFYIAFIIQIIIYAIRMIKKKISIAAPFTASIALFVTMSVTSHLIIYPNYFYLIMIFWGICIAKYENLYNQKRRSLM
ncbi:MAG: O-antigen ligase family protein, partial [Bacillota bacterium]|nr:O-antigen ligase family protein [Bacillota bacterium]